MEIRINGKRAALKKDTSFEYVAENRLFSGSDGYSLSITFPLRNCRENLEIFGHINRMDVMAGKVIFDCEIRSREFYKFGSITITDINEAEVKTQFLEGRSEQNFYASLDDVFINELELGDATDADNNNPASVWDPMFSQNKYVALPWVNNYSGNIQNLAEYNAESEKFTWDSHCTTRSWQPYLLYLTKKICEAVRYSYDFSAWEADERYKYLLVCNTIPAAWDMPDFSNALPHWSVHEYFEKLELFMNGEFNINHRDMCITFAFTEQVIADLPPVSLQDVIDEHSVAVTEEDADCDYFLTKNIVYKDCDHEMWKFYSCDWFIKGWKKKTISYESLAELLADNQDLAVWNGSGSRGSNRDKLFYAKDVDAYFIVRSLSKTLVQEHKPPFANLYSYKMELRPVNLFGGRITDDSDDADSVEIEFVPAWIDDTGDTYGRLLYLSFAGYDDNSNTEGSPLGDPNARKDEIDATLFQPLAVQTLEQGEAEKKSEYYDKIYIAWWDGAGIPSDGRLPHPYAENIEILPDWSNYLSTLHFSLRICNRFKNSQHFHQINHKQKLEAKFLADTIPNPRAVFFIKGKKYICEKLSATFTEHGMSQLISGSFYPIVE